MYTCPRRHCIKISLSKTMHMKKSHLHIHFLPNQGYFYVNHLQIQGLVLNRKVPWKWASNIATNDCALLYRVRQKEAEEEERSREYMEDRMQAILSLKGNIETNKL